MEKVEQALDSHVQSPRRLVASAKSKRRRRSSFRDDEDDR